MRGLPCGLPKRSPAVSLRLDTKIAAMIAITRFRPSSTEKGYIFAFCSSSAWIENTLHRVTPAMKGVIFPCPSAIRAFIAASVVTAPKPGRCALHLRSGPKRSPLERRLVPPASESDTPQVPHTRQHTRDLFEWPAENTPLRSSNPLWFACTSGNVRASMLHGLLVWEYGASPV